MVLSANDKQQIRDRIKKLIEALKAKTTPTAPPKEEEGEGKESKQGG